MPDFKNGISVNGLPLADGGGNVVFGRLPVAPDGTTSAAALVRADDSRLFDGRAPLGPAGGDLGGTYPDPTVVGLWGRAIAPSDPLHGQVYWFNGVSDIWEPASLTPSPFAVTIGDGSTTEFVITHNLDTRDVVVNVWETDEPYSAVTVETELTSDDEITLLFGLPPDQDAYRVVVAQGGGGAVSRVELTAPSQFVVLGNPITTAGVLDLTWATQTANRVLAGPASGPAAAPSFRTLVAGDLPVHPHSAADITTGQLVDARLTSNVLLKSGNLADLADPSAARSNLGLGSAAVLDRGAADGVASLDSEGKIPTTQLPAIAISDTFVVEDEEAMLDTDAEAGDVAVRTDLSKSFILTTAPASTLANWQELLTPTDVVTSVAGRTGDVLLQWSDINSPPTTIVDYGITDAYTKAQADARYAPIAVPWSSITGVPSTLAYKNTDNQFTTAQGIRGAASGQASGLYVPSLASGTLPLIMAGDYSSNMAGQVAIYGKALNRAAVQGDSYGETGVYGRNTSNAGWGMVAEVSYSATSAIRTVMRLRHISSATTLAGFGTQLDLEASRGAAPYYDAMASIVAAWTDPATTDAYLTLGVASGGLPSEVMRLTSDLRVGIGVTAPNYTLEAVMRDIYPAINIAEASTTSRRATLGFGLNAAANTGWIMGQGYNNDTTKDFYLIDVTAGLIRLYIGTGGNVGIGTSAPSAKLDVTDGYIRARSGANNAPSVGAGVEILYVSGTGYVQSYNRDTSAYMPLTFGASAFTFNNNITIGSQNAMVGTHPSYTGYIAFWKSGSDYTILSDGTNTLINAPGASGTIYFRANNNAPGTTAGQMRIDANGNVVVRGGLYPGDQGSYYLSYDSNPAGLSTNAAMSALYFYPGWPSNTSSYLYYSPSPLGIGINGNLYATGNLYVGNQSGYYIAYWGSGGHITNGHFVAGGNIYPSNQSSYYLTYESGQYSTGYSGITIVGNVATTGTFLTNQWFRSIGASGWYNQTYSGGWYMSDSTWIRSYNNKPVLIECSGGTNLQLGGGTALRQNWSSTATSNVITQYYDGTNFNFYSSAINANVLVIYSGTGFGRVGIRQDGPSYALHVGLDSCAKPNGGSWTNSSSDIRTKTVDGEYEYGLAAVMDLHLVRYTYNGRGGTPAGHKGVGFVAQEAVNVIPEMVSTRMAKLDPSDAEETELLTINNDPAIYATIKAVQELGALVEVQRQTIADLQTQVAALTSARGTPRTTRNKK